MNENEAEFDLDVAGTDALIAALSRRCKSLVVIMGHGSDGRAIKEWWTDGNHYECLGLIASLYESLVHSDKQIPIDDDEGEDWKAKA